MSPIEPEFRGAKLDGLARARATTACRRWRRRIATVRELQIGAVDQKVRKTDRQAIVGAPPARTRAFGGVPFDRGVRAICRFSLGLREDRRRLGVLFS